MTILGLTACTVDPSPADETNVATNAQALGENDWFCWRWTDDGRTQYISNSKGGGKLHSACESFNTDHPRDPWNGLVPHVSCVNQAVGAPDTSYTCPWWGYWGPEPVLVDQGNHTSCPEGQSRIGDDGTPTRLPDGTVITGGICMRDDLVFHACTPATSCSAYASPCGSVPDGCGGSLHCFGGCNFPDPQIPCSFQWDYYLDQNPDLRAAGINDAAGARTHYDLHGRSEGRRCNRIGCSPCN